MSSRRSVTETLQAVTTAMFRCEGMGRQSSGHDRFGWHDLAWWVVVGAVAAAWYFMLYEPQRQRNQMLRGRLDVLKSQLKAEETELNRVRREVTALESDDPQAWERAARARLGWLEPDEVLDVLRWRRDQIAAGHPDPLPGLIAPPIVRPTPTRPRRAQASPQRRPSGTPRARDTRRRRTPVRTRTPPRPRRTPGPSRGRTPTRTASWEWGR